MRDNLERKLEEIREWVEEKEGEVRMVIGGDFNEEGRKRRGRREGRGEG